MLVLLASRMAVKNFPIGLVAASVGKSREEFVAEGGRARPQTFPLSFLCTVSLELACMRRMTDSMQEGCCTDNEDRPPKHKGGLSW